MTTTQTKKQKRHQVCSGPKVSFCTAVLARLWSSDQVLFKKLLACLLEAASLCSFKFCLCSSCPHASDFPCRQVAAPAVGRTLWARAPAARPWTRSSTLTVSSAWPAAPSCAGSRSSPWRRRPTASPATLWVAVHLLLLLLVVNVVNVQMKSLFTLNTKVHSSVYFLYLFLKEGIFRSLFLGRLDVFVVCTVDAELSEFPAD